MTNRKQADNVNFNFRYESHLSIFGQQRNPHILFQNDLYENKRAG